MSLVKWTPRRLSLTSFPLPSVGDEIDRFFDGLFQRSLDGTVFSSGRWMPAFDVVEKDKEYIIRVEAPGIEKEDINVAIKDNVLTISGEKKEDKEDNSDLFYCKESSYGHFSRSFHLPTQVDEKKIKAEYRNGILTVALPRKQPVEPKQIPVKTS